MIDLAFPRVSKMERRLAGTTPDFKATVRVAKWLRSKRPFVPNIGYVGNKRARMVVPVENWPKEDLPA